MSELNLSRSVVYRQTVLPNGLAVITATDAAAQVSDLALLVRAGYRYERPHEAGYAHFLEHMLMKGTVGLPTPELLAGAVERLGGYRNAHTWMNRVWYDIQVAAEHTEGMVALLADIMFRSLLDPVRIQQEKGPIIQELKRAIAEPQRFTERRGRELFYGKHPLGRTILQTEKTTQDTTRERLLEHLARLYGADRSALVVVGPMTHEAVLALAEQLFGGWKRAGELINETVPFTPAGSFEVHEHRDLPQTFINVWYPGPTSGSRREQAALELLRTFLSGGSSSLLTRELRHKRSLVYWQSLETESYPDNGSIQFSTAAEKPAVVTHLARQLMETVSTAFTPDDLEAARLQAVGAFKRRLSSGPFKLAYILDLFAVQDGLIDPDEWLKDLAAVTHEDVLRVAERYLRTEYAVTYTLGPKG